MFQYVAFVWNDQDCGSKEAARRIMDRHPSHLPEWQVAVRQKGLEVRYAGARPGSSEACLLHDGAGVVLGKLFVRNTDGPSTSAPSEIGARESQAVLASRGKRLIEHYWGRYVAFLRDANSSTTWVIRDPSGGLPCFRLQFGGVDVYFSSIENVLDLSTVSCEINWPYIAAGVSQMRQTSNATALSDVYQVLGGECVEIRESRVNRTFYWDPLEIAGSQIIDDPVEATRAMRQSVRDVVQAWASCYQSILLSLSGGLDSSIVLACLRDAPSQPRVTCFHYYPLGSDLDERGYARIAARTTSYELIERPRDSALHLEPLLSNVRIAPEPSSYLYFLEHSRTDAQLAAERDASAVFIGFGGDQLFYQERSFWAAGDYLVQRGLRPGALRVALDAAFMDRVSVWHVLREALAQYFLHRRWSPLDEAGLFRPLITREVIEEVKNNAAFLHPLLTRSTQVPSGKLWQASQVIQPWEYYDPIGRPDDPERVAPLCSQPVMETCLRIPSYVLTLGGWDRAIARRAFYDEVPRQILNRRNKGLIEDHVRSILAHNIVFVRELLMDGHLVGQGIVDRRKLGTVLSGQANRISATPGELMDYISAEAWLHRWERQAHRAAA